MLEYPLTHVSKQIWNKKVQATLMFSIPAQDEALPILYELVEVLQNLNNKQLQQVLAQDCRQYFFNEVFPQVCTKIIKSRYFKNQIVLTLSNKILANCLYLYIKYMDLANKFTGLSQILAIVLASDQYYFKTNNQLDFKLYPHYYFDTLSNIQFTNTIKQGDMVDVIKSNGKYDKLIWTRGKVLVVNQSYLQIEYLNDVHQRLVTIDRQSFQVAPYKSKSHDFQWRMSLKPGDIIDCQDHFGGWYHGTVIKIICHDDFKKSVKVSFKVYDQNGNKSDENGKFYGFADQQETIDVTVPRIMPFCSTCKYRNYESIKPTIETDDSNDMVFQQLGGQTIYAFPRKRCLSQFYFRQLNKFGRMGGFEKPLQKLHSQINFQFLCNYVKGIGNICQYLHKKIVIQLVNQLKIIVEKHIFGNTDIVTKQFTKQRSQALFNGLKSLMKRLFCPDDVYKYQNTLKMKLVSQCLDSQALKRKLQGLHQLKDIVRSMSHSFDRTKSIKKWIIEQKIFEKIYLQNSHVQLVKKSEDFFKFLINQDILQVKDLQRLYKIAQKGDYESRVSLYKLFQQMSHVFNKSHVDFLIDTILESDLNVVLNQDIDMLHQLSRFSNYFPKQKVKDFFQRLILNDTKNKQLTEYAIKKYSQIVSRGYQMKNYRKQIIKTFVKKINTQSYEKVIKVLKGIFEGISVGQWGKKDLTQILEEENVQNIIVQVIQQSHEKSDYRKIVNEMLNFQLFLVKLSHRIKIKLSTLRKIWGCLKLNDSQNSKKIDYYQWLNQIIQCDQGIQVDEGEQQANQSLQNFYRQIFWFEMYAQLSKQQFMLARNLFVQINKKSKFLTVSNIIRDKEVEKQYKRRVEMKSLKLLSEIQHIINQCKHKQIYDQAHKFYLQLYSSKENSADQINDFLSDLLVKFKQANQKKETGKIQRLINLIQMVINDSQKYQQFELISMIKCRRGSFINVSLINDVSYLSDSIRKENLFERSNISLLQLKQKISSKLNVPFEQLKIIGKFQLSDYYNSYTLAQLNINSDQSLTVSRRILSSHPEEQLIIEGKMNPKALRIFKIIFQKYSSENSLMSKQDYNKFTASCLGTYSKNYYDKIVPIYNKYDSDHDGFLNLDDFIRFYTDAALDKPSTVWNNLKNLHVKGNFKFKDQADQVLRKQDLPRFKLYNNEQFYDMLFKLLQQKQISKTIFNFLLRLPANKAMHQQLRNIWNQDISQIGKQNLQRFLTQKSKFRLMYKLILILNILEYNQTNNSIWNVKFSISKGYQIPFKFLKKLAESKQPYISIDLDIMELIFQIIKDYIYNAFVTKQSSESSSLFEQDLTFQQKMEYLVTGVYPKSYNFLKKDYSYSYRYQWQDKKQLFIQLFLNILIKMKTQLIPQKQPSRRNVLSSMISKMMSVLSSLMINQQQTKLIPVYPLLFDERQSSKTLTQFYTMILCICYYSRVGEQHVHIHQLFKYIKSKNITSQHFRILALLVSKFGLQQDNLSQIPQILLQNILEQQNQPTIQGCAKLLCNFDVSQLSSITRSHVQKIFNKCLFGDKITCLKQQSRSQIYQLLIKISQVNKQIAQQVVQKTTNVILQNMPLMKVTYSSQVNKRCSYGYVGLKNLGNICYMNSMIQQLYINKTFRYLLLRVNDLKQQEITFDHRGQKVDDNLLHQIQRIFAYLQHSTRQDFAPSAFCVAYKPFGQSVNVMMQQDVQQFVSMFFDRLQQGIKQHPLKNLIQNFYTGKTTNLFKCHNCKKTKKIQQNFHSLTLQVKNSKNLSESFNRYALGQVINDFRCDFCDQKVDVSKMTRISKPPHVLIIHLQRIFFNLDTFINQKITTRHQFPMELNIYNYTLQHYQREESSQPHDQDISQYDYQLTGIIIHIGNAQSGHYISYIKAQQNKWFQFNDSLVSLFSAASIQSECFGGISSTFEDDFQWQKKQTSKSAYLLLYSRKSDPKIELILDQKQFANKTSILTTLQLQEQIQKINNQEYNNEKSSEPTQSQEQTGSAFQDSQKEKQKQKYRQQQDMKQLQMIKQKKSQDRIKEKSDYAVEKTQKDEKFILNVRPKITNYMSNQLKQQIQIDNRVHFFQTSLASQSFSTFFAKLISIPHLHSQELIRMCQKLTFSFWLKSKSFKQLLQALQIYLKTHPQNVDQLVLKNQVFYALLIQNSNIDIRVNVAYFLGNVINNYALSTHDKEAFLDSQSEQGKNIIRFLNKMFQLLPTTVTKCWTKFNQYFQFWFFISEKKIFAKYMVDKQMLKNFVDYFLDKKSPLKIYSTKKVQQIGSSYATPDFSMLLRCVSIMLNYYFSPQNNFTLTQQDQIVLLHFQFIQKLIADCYQQIAAKMAKQICPNNARASQKFAVVLLKGFSKSTYQNVQKYIQVLKQFVTIEDDYQQMRMQWVLGKQTLNVSTITKSLTALNSKSMEQRLYLFDSSLFIQQGATFLQPIFQLNKRVENFCILCVQGIIQICLKSKVVRQYVFNLGGPTLTYRKYLDFYQQFITRYIEQSKKSYYSTVTYFNKTQLGQSVKQNFNKLMQLRKIQDIDEEANIEEAGLANKNLQQNKDIRTDNYMNQQHTQALGVENLQKQVKQQDGLARQQKDFAKMQFLDGSFTLNNKQQNQSSSNMLNKIDSNNEAQSQSELGREGIQTEENTKQLKSNQNQGQHQDIMEWQEVNFQDQQNNKKQQQNQQEQNISKIIQNIDTQLYQAQNKKQQQINTQPQILENKDDFPADYYDNPQMWQDKYNPYYAEQPGFFYEDGKSNKNNSRKSQVEGNNSRDEDFQGIQMKQINDILNSQNTKQTKDQFLLQPIQKNKQEARQPQLLDLTEVQIMQALNQNDNKSSDWSRQSNQHVLGSPPKTLGRRKRNRNKVGLKIQSKKRLSDQKQNNSNNSELQVSEGDQNEPFIINQKNNNQNQPVQDSLQSEPIKSIFQPVQFIYHPIATLPVQQQISGIQATYHQSQIIYIKTQPTGKGNKAFSGTYGSGKLINRIKEQFWQTRRTQLVKGYFISNHSRMYARVQTPEGCQLIKSNESAWIWSQSILKIWKCERSSDWPEWSLFQ